jgi:cysteine desulfurase / selenocysteine lyase
MLDIQALRSEFPALTRRSDGSNRVYLDNAATTLQPRAVITAVSDFYGRGHSPAVASTLYADARARIARIVGASNPGCVVFCASATHAIHLVAESWGNANIGIDDEIVVSSAEHVANLACWQRLAHRRGANLRVIPVDAAGALPADTLRKALSSHTKLVAITHVSNVSGAVFPVREIVAAAHAVGAHVLIDGAQAAAHTPVEFDALDADFYAFSGHKVFAPTGIGVLLGKSACLDMLAPVLLGTNAFDAFTLEDQPFAPVPNRFEGGTANIAGAVALAEALEFIERLGWDKIADNERRMCARLDAGLATIEGVSMLGRSSATIGIRSFVVSGRGNSGIERDMRDRSIDIRAGNLSAQMLLHQFGVDSALRASIAVYNDADDIERFVTALATSVRSRC